MANWEAICNRAYTFIVTGSAVIATWYLVRDHFRHVPEAAEKITQPVAMPLSGIPSTTLWWAYILLVLCGAFLLTAWAKPLLVKIGALWPWARVPIQDAAQDLYEACERAGALEYFVAQGSDPLYKLETFKYVMMVDDETVLFGIEPPSRAPRPIPSKEARGPLRPIEGTSQFNHGTPYDKVAYTDVTISRKDLRRLKKTWPKQVKADALRFKTR